MHLLACFVHRGCSIDATVLIRVFCGTILAMLQDLIQFKDREKWYAAKFCSDDAPDWNPGSFVSSERAAPGRKLITVDAEISRDKVPIRNAYKHVGQRATLRVNSGPERDLFGGHANPRVPWVLSLAPQSEELCIWSCRKLCAWRLAWLPNAVPSRPVLGLVASQRSLT